MFTKPLIQTLTASALITTAFFSGCGSDSDGKTKVSRAAVKSNYVTMAAAAYSDSVTTAETLQTAIATFVSTPNDETLDAARAAYKAARVPYQQSEIMRWDGSITQHHNPAEGGLSSIDDREGQVNAWPLDESLIEHIITNGSNELSAQSLASQNGSLTPSQQQEVDNETDADKKQALIDRYGETNITTGFHAIEFLLWDKDANAKGPGQRLATEFNCDKGIDATSEECRNADYLQAAAELLVTDLKAMKAEWTNTNTGTLAHNFLASDNAIDYMVQALASMAVGELGGARLSAGLWRDLSAIGGGIKAGDQEEEHDCFSDLSHVAVYYNFQALMNAFYGSYTKLDGSKITGASLGDYIRSVDAGLYKQLDDVLQSANAQMQIVYDAGEATPGKSFDQIITDSYNYYDSNSPEHVTVKSAELIAVEAAITELAKVKTITLDVIDALSLAGVDAGSIGDTD